MALWTAWGWRGCPPWRWCPCTSSIPGWRRRSLHGNKWDKVILIEIIDQCIKRGIGQFAPSFHCLSVRSVLSTAQWPDKPSQLGRPRLPTRVVITVMDPLSWPGQHTCQAQAAVTNEAFYTHRKSKMQTLVKTWYYSVELLNLKQMLKFSVMSLT